MTWGLVTTFSQKGYQVYGKRMLESITEFWPDDVKVYAFYEGEKPDDATERAEWVSLDSDPDHSEFMAQHQDQSPSGVWDYRKGLVTYCHKVFAYTKPRDVDHLCWLDADTETIGRVTYEFLDGLVRPATIGSYLARPWRHTETGFLIFSLRNGAGEFLDELRGLYTSGEVAKLPELHDCAAFDHIRKQWERRGYRFHNLCPDAIGLNAFIQSPLARVIRHNKGPDNKKKVYGDDMVVYG